MTRVVMVVSGSAEAMARLQKIEDSLRSPHDGLVRATNKVADVFRKNFDSEGSMVGGWPALAEVTENVREYFGYEASGPILFRYGALRGVAVEFFQKAKGPGSKSMSDDYSSQTTSATLDINGKVATLQAQGWKVANQWGHPNRPPFGPVPARPFWFVSSESIAAARDGLHDWLLDEVLK